MTLSRPRREHSADDDAGGVRVRLTAVAEEIATTECAPGIARIQDCAPAAESSPEISAYSGTILGSYPIAQP